MVLKRMCLCLFVMRLKTNAIGSINCPRAVFWIGIVFDSAETQLVDCPFDAL